MNRPSKNVVARTLAVTVASAVLGPALVASPAHAAASVTVDAGGKGAVIDSKYSTTLTVTGRGFQSITKGHGGVYVWFGTVNGKWKPTQGGQSGVNYVYVPDKETKDNAGFQRYVAFPGSNTASAANGGTLSASGAFSTSLVVPGPTFEAVGRNGKTTTVDCREVTCGVITIGAHGVRNGANETFTPVKRADLQGAAGAETPSAPAANGNDSTGSKATKNTAPGKAAPSPSKGPAELSVDHAAAVSGRAMSFTASGLTPGEQFTVVLDDGLAAVGPFTVAADGRASGVLGIPVHAAAGTHEIRLFGATKEASKKFGVSAAPADVATTVASEDERPLMAWIFAGLAGIAFLGALFVAVRRAVKVRRAQA